MDEKGNFEKGDILLVKEDDMHHFGMGTHKPLRYFITKGSGGGDKIDGLGTKIFGHFPATGWSGYIRRCNVEKFFANAGTEIEDVKKFHEESRKYKVVITDGERTNERVLAEPELLFGVYPDGYWKNALYTTEEQKSIRLISDDSKFVYDAFKGDNGMDRPPKLVYETNQFSLYVDLVEDAA